MQWWGALLAEERPFAVTRAGGLLVLLGAMNTLQVIAFVGTWLAPIPFTNEYRKLVLIMTPIQVVYGVVRLGVGLAVLRRVSWAGRAGVGVAMLAVFGVIVFVIQAWGVDIGPDPSLPLWDVAINAALVAVAVVVILIDGSVIRDLIRHQQWFISKCEADR